MKRVVILLMAALLFVGCEKKEDGAASKGKAKSKQANSKAAKIGTYDLTINVPAEAKIKEGVIGGFDISFDGVSINVKPGGTLVPMKKTLADAMAKAKKDYYTDVKGEELANGYYFTGEESNTWRVKARIDKGGKTFEVYAFGTSTNKDKCADIIAAVKTIK